MHNWHPPSEPEDDGQQIPKNIFLSDKTIDNLHSKGWFEIDSRTVDSADSRILQINDRCFKMDDMCNESDSQYEAFLLEVERANNEFFKSKNSGSSYSYHQPTSSSGTANFGMSKERGISSKNSEFDYGAYENGDYYDVDTFDDVQNNDYCLGDEQANGHEYGAVVEEDFADAEDSDDEVNEEDEEVNEEDEEVIEEDNDDEEIDPAAELPLDKVQKVSAGYIVNSSVFLTVSQWHTLIPDTDINQTYCAVCDEYIDVDTDAEHIEEEEHLNFVNVYKPLKRFELSITRLIRTKYHCGVCNVLFDDRDDNNHVDTKQHGDSMLFAINKASDIVDEYSLDRSREGATRPDESRDKRLDTMTYPLSNPTSSASYSSCFTKPPRVSVERVATPEFEDDYESYEPPESQQPGVSYAAMARKSKLEDLPDVLKIELDDKLVTVKYDSWHMIISTGLNQLYCMACLVSEPKRGKADHCRSNTHLEKLMKCSVVKVYETHLIRKVDEKLYHCGHCNNLQPIDLMDEHVEQYHPRTSRAPALARNGVHQLLGTALHYKPENQPIGSTNPPNTGIHASSSIQPPNFGNQRGASQPLSPMNQPFSPILIPNKGNQLTGNQACSPVNQQFGPFQPPRNGNQLVGSSQAHSPAKQLFGPIQPPKSGNQPASANLDHNNGLLKIDQRPGPSQTWNHVNNQVVGPDQTWNESQRTNELPSTNLQRLKESGLSNTMELIDKQADLNKSSQNSPHTQSSSNLAIGQENGTSKSSPAKSDPVEYFKSIWQERSPTHSPKPEPPKTEANNEPVTSVTKETDKETKDTVNSEVEAKVLPPTAPSQVNKVSKNVPVFNFQPDFVKTIHQFGYKLSIHILSLNAIIKVQCFYRCVFCDVPIEEALLLEHMLDYRHVALIPTAPYMPEFSLHLIRRINMLLHCAICNLVLLNDQLMVMTHNASPTHSFLLKKALGFHAHMAANPPAGNFAQPNQPKSPANPALPPPVPLPPFIPLPPSRSNTPTPIPTTQNDAPPTPTKTKKPKPAEAPEEVLVNFTEEFYLVKQKKQLVKVRGEALNTIVFCGDGSFYCFVCESNIGTGDSMEHIVDKGHRKRLTDSKMLRNYGNSLLRQLDNMYHCATCNVIIQKKFLQRHLDWYRHLKNTEETLCNTECDKLDDNQAELPRIDIPTQKERYNVKEKGKFVLHFAFVIDKNHGRRDSNDNVVHEVAEAVAAKKMNKIVIVKDEVFKIKWEHWQGLVSYKDCYKCKICACDLDEERWREHVQEPKHVAGLGKPLIEELGRDLLRQLSDSKLHCLICNVELSTSDNICEHLDGKRHNKNRDLIIEESAKVNAYSDCENDVLFV